MYNKDLDLENNEVDIFHFYWDKSSLIDWNIPESKFWFYIKSASLNLKN